MLKTKPKNKKRISRKLANRFITAWLVVSVMLIGTPFAFANYPAIASLLGSTEQKSADGNASLADATATASSSVAGTDLTALDPLAASNTPQGSVGTAPTSNGIPDAPSRGQASIIKMVDAETNYLGGIALDAAGKVWTWGYNAYGQLGTGRAVSAYAGGMTRLPYFVDNNINVVDIAGGYHTSFAVDDQGTVYAWGNGTQGQMGNGTVTAINTTPKVVTSLAGVRITRVFTSTEWECAVYAIDDQGVVYAWGSGLYNRIPGTSSASNSTARRITQLDAIDVVDLAIGDNFGLALDSAGDVYSWGLNANGQLGHGNTTAKKDPTKIDFFANIKVTGISAMYHTAMALDSAGTPYIWGARYVMSGNTRTSYTSPADPSMQPIIYSPYGVLNNLSTPVKVNFDVSSSPYNNVAPAVAKVIAGRYANYVIDVNGRTWYMGWNTFYSFGTDGRLFTTVNGGKHSTYVTDLTLLRTLGDGDTEGYLNDVKAPVFSGVTSTGNFSSQFASYRNHGQWSQMADGLHPTIYDKKYMETTEDGSTTSHTNKYPLDAQGRRLVYVVKRDTTSPITYSGNFYVASASYNGGWIVDNRSTTALPAGVTAETSVPKVKDDEASWIGLVVDLDTFDYTGRQLNELPYMSNITTYQSATLFIDNAGNLYRTSLDGSGSIAWGWDYSVYERLTAGNNATNGLYNFYFYEIMYMRGAPNVGYADVTFDRTLSKIYLVEDANGNTPTDSVTVSASVPSAVISSQLNLTVTPRLTDLRYVFIPYDPADPFFAADEVTVAMFEAAYASGQYQSGSLLTPGVVYENADYSFNVDISDNGRLLVLSEDHAYTRTAQHVASYIADNFYTPIEVNHEGIGTYEGRDSYSRQLYAPTADNVAKAPVVLPGYVDLSPYYGIPLDANGNVIANPSFGYDVVTATAYPVLPGGLYDWEFVPGQDNPQVFTLDDDSLLVFEAGVQVPYVHQFFYRSTGTPQVVVSKAVADEFDAYGRLPADGLASPTERLFYTITATNIGTAPAFDVLIQDSLSSLAPYVSYDPGYAVTITLPDGSVQLITMQQLISGYTIELLDFDDSLEVTFAVTVNHDLDCNTVTSLSNLATIGNGSGGVTIPTTTLKTGVVNVIIDWGGSPPYGPDPSVTVLLNKDGQATGQTAVAYPDVYGNYQTSFTDLETGHTYSVLQSPPPAGFNTYYIPYAVTLTPLNNEATIVIRHSRIVD